MPAAYDRLPLGALRVFEAVATQLSFSAAAWNRSKFSSRISSSCWRKRIAQAWHLTQVSTRQVDHDMVIEGYLPALPRAEVARREECGGSHGAAGRASCSPAS